MKKDSRVVNLRKAEARREMKTHTVLCKNCTFPFKTMDGTVEVCPDCDGIHEDHRAGMHEPGAFGLQPDRCVLCQYEEVVAPIRKKRGG